MFEISPDEKDRIAKKDEEARRDGKEHMAK